MPRARAEFAAIPGHELATPREPYTIGRHCSVPDAPMTSTFLPPYVDRLADLGQLLVGEANLAILRRQLPPTLTDYCRDTVARSGLQVRTILRAPQIATADLLPGLPASPGRDALADDVGALLRWFWSAFAPQQVGLRLIAVPGEMCRRFHVDYVTVRLLTTYTGAGTQWVADGDVDRSQLGGDAADDESLLLRRAGAIENLAPGDIGLLKGEAWPGNRGRGAVHRSPPASATPRVLFSLEPIQHAH